MINSTKPLICNLNLTLPPGGMSTELQAYSGMFEGGSSGQCAIEMSAESSLEKGLGLFTWPSGPLPTAQVCKLLKATVLGVGHESFHSIYSQPRRCRWGLFCSKEKKRPLYHQNPHLHCKIYRVESSHAE